MNVLVGAVVNVSAAVRVPNKFLKPQAPNRFNDLRLGFPEQRVVNAHVPPEDLANEICEECQ